MENIPLRIMLLLMDEVFDLRNKNQWLRRRIVAILRQLIKAMLGDKINRFGLVYNFTISSEFPYQYCIHTAPQLWNSKLLL